jgi:glycosyltransferase involved in cell wall biosynthesis
MRRTSGIGGQAYSWIRAAPPIRWAVGRLSPERRRAVRRLLGDPSRSDRPIAPPAPRERDDRRSDGAVVYEGPPFAPDGSGSEPRVNVIGHFLGESGMAEAARSLVTAARAAHVDVALVSADPRGARRTDLRFADVIGTDTPHPINVICVNANETAQLMDAFGPQVTGGRHNIGFWFWELARFPAPWQAAIERVDEIWVASTFVSETMAAATRKPVRTVRLAVDATPSRTYRRSEFGLVDDVFTFLFTFNFNSYVARKNPLATIRAFLMAFPDRRERVALVIKPTNVDKAGDRLRQLREAIGGDERILVIDRLMSRDEIFGLESVIDSYVSLHRSEGFGLGLAESMFLGKPVIGTAYSGNLEFMNDSNSLLLDYQLTAVGEHEYPFAEGQVWAEPSEDHAVELMRRLVGDPAFGGEVGARARAHMLQQFSADAVGAGIARRLAAILDGAS